MNTMLRDIERVIWGVMIVFWAATVIRIAHDFLTGATPWILW